MSDSGGATRWINPRLRQEGMEDGAITFRLTKSFFVSLAPLVDWLVQARISADSLSVLSVICAGFAAVALTFEHDGVSFLLLVFSGVCDLLDGWVARTQQSSSPAGELLDTLCDRLSELMILGAFLGNGMSAKWGEGMRRWGVSAAAVALVGALMMSFASALLRNRPKECSPVQQKSSLSRGIFRRPERAVVTAFAALLLHTFPGISFSLLWMMGVGAWSSAVLRILAYRNWLLRKAESSQETETSSLLIDAQSSDRAE